jgi:hypothetical protein|tara:strand:- start:763 stop:1185 length:423 start_codon:yes stop_codon:yes gene_type:complete
MATYNNLITQEFVKETRTDGAVTSITIKVVAYDGDNNMTTVTGSASGEYLVHTDSTWQNRTIEDEVYYDWDNCTALTSQTMNYTVPEADQTSLTQSTTHPHNHTEQLEYQTKRIAWEDSYKVLSGYDDLYSNLTTAVDAL